MQVIDDSILKDDDPSPCSNCLDKQVCSAMSEEEPWAYSEQVALCFDLCEPSFHDVDYWVNKVCMEARDGQ